MQFIYQTERLELRILSSDYASLVRDFYLKNRDFLKPFEPKRPENFFSIGFQQNNLYGEYKAFLKLNHIRFWLFRRNDPSVIIGSACFSNIVRGAFQKCMVGYKLDQLHCHQGYMTEALSFLVPMVARELKLHRVEAFVQPNNESSVALLSRLHFKEEGYLSSFAEINGKWTDHLLFSYFPDEN
ncbi:MAG: GNAT family N-acetyltransferase [Lachnospiraceae bacterium]|nr:GNAT family N-acetyltransferase [Lachnospiraceae bacterium]